MIAAVSRVYRTQVDALTALIHLLRVLRAPEGSPRLALLSPTSVASAIIASGLTLAVSTAVIAGNRL